MICSHGELGRCWVPLITHMAAFPSSSRFGLWPGFQGNHGFLQSSFSAGKPFVSSVPFDAKRLSVIPARRKKKKKRAFPINPDTSLVEKDTRIRLCFAYSHPHDGHNNGLPSFHQFTSRWISSQLKLPNLPLSLVVQNLKKQPLNLSRIVVCWYQNRVRNSGQAMLTSTRNFLSEKSMLIIKGFAFVGSVILLGMLSLYVQAKAQTHIEKHVLPPVAHIVGAYLGRNVGFQKVQSVSPLGLTLESCYVGPHEEEFSCGELPFVEIRVRPFASLQRGQIVLDAVLLQPNILVCQKKDWSWLGINTTNGKSSLRNVIDESLDTRTKTRRLSREQVGLRIAGERDDEARRSAKSGYILNGEQFHGHSNTKSTRLVNSGFESEERDIILSESFSGISSNNDVQYTTGDLDKHFYEVLPGGEDEHKNVFEDSPVNAKIDLSRSLLDCKTWFDTYFVKPVPLFKNWNMKDTSSRLECQRRNLDASAEAARAYFERLDHSNRWNDLNDRDAQMVRQSLLDRSSESQNTMNKTSLENGLMHTLSSALTLTHESDDTSARLEVVSDMYESTEDSGNGVIFEGQERNIDIGADGEMLDTHVDKFEMLLEEKPVETALPDDGSGNEMADEKYESGVETIVANSMKMSSTQNKPSDFRTVKGFSLYRNRTHIHEFEKDGRDVNSMSLSDMASLSTSNSAHVETMLKERPWWKSSALATNVLDKESSTKNDKVREIANQLLAQAKSNLDAAPLQNWVPATLNSIYIRNGTLMLLAYGDVEPR